MIGTELLDDRRADPAAVRAELRDIARLNALFGGTRAVVRELEPWFRAAPHDAAAPWTLLDVGTGGGDIACAVARAARGYGLAVTPVGVELNPTAARVAHATGLAAVVADGSALPVGPRSVDIVIASQVLHHLPRGVAVRWIARFDQVARRVVVLADLRRSRLAMAGVWAAALGLGMSRVTRHDAVVSLARGYTRAEFTALLRAAGVPAVARARLGCRLVASWRPGARAVPGRAER